MHIRVWAYENYIPVFVGVGVYSMCACLQSVHLCVLVCRCVCMRTCVGECVSLRVCLKMCACNAGVRVCVRTSYVCR